ncbi:MAG: 1,4-dihydroxy-6-naphthoate synthase [bacterium]
MRPISLAFSSCPNDTFIFYALVNRKIDTDEFIFKEELADIDRLNQMAFAKEIDVVKVSYHAFGYLRDQYNLLRSGGALGRRCGPLLVAKVPVTRGDIVNKTIAIPGEYTTAFLLLRLYQPEVRDVVSMQFDRIMPAVKNGDVDAGLIIHEGRFTYPQYGLKKIIDLGEWWEDYTGCLIPLGCIIIKKKLGKEIAQEVERLIKESITYAYLHKEEVREYIKMYAQELEDSVIDNHINLYVNEYSLDIGQEGERAVRVLFGLFPPAIK